MHKTAKTTITKTVVKVEEPFLLSSLSTSVLDLVFVLFNEVSYPVVVIKILSVSFVYFG